MPFQARGKRLFVKAYVPAPPANPVRAGGCVKARRGFKGRARKNSRSATKRRGPFLPWKTKAAPRALCRPHKALAQYPPPPVTRRAQAEHSGAGLPADAMAPQGPRKGAGLPAPAGAVALRRQTGPFWRLTAAAPRGIFPRFPQAGEGLPAAVSCGLAGCW